MRQRAAILSLAAGLAVIVVAQVGAPLASPPLYDGVVLQDPYNYLAPAPGQKGSPTSVHSSPRVDGSTSPQFVAATTESPPQAQLIALPGAFELGAGATSLSISIEPAAAAAAPPADRRISGNAYRFAVADQAGSALPINPGTLPTLVLRSPDSLSGATIWRLAGATWQELPTQPSGQPGIYTTNVTELGDFALIVPVVPGADTPGIDARLVVFGALPALLTVVLLGALLWWRRRRLRVVAAPPRRVAPPPSHRRRGGRRRGSP